MSCSHRYPGEWKEVRYYDADDDEPSFEYEYVGGEDSFRDVGLHAYECTQCGELFYYSSRGKIATEKGISIEEVTDEELHNDG